MINNTLNTQSYLSESILRTELNNKYAQLNKIDKDNALNNDFKTYNDYFEESIIDGKYDKNDYERVLDKFRNKDSEIRLHEQTHTSLTGTISSIQYSYQMGPDGKMYAVGGSVRLDTSIPSDTNAAINKLDSIISSATSSGANMSAADSSIATSANLMKMRLNFQVDETSLKY